MGCEPHGLTVSGALCKSEQPPIGENTRIGYILGKYLHTQSYAVDYINNYIIKSGFKHKKSILLMVKYI